MAKIITRQFANIKENSVKSVHISLATSKDVLEWSHGEVTKPETINYKSFKPEKHGLFDEVIFGPTVDYKCPICNKKYKKSNVGQICEKTDECKIVQPEILPKISRRSRMGHIELASPVVHFWFSKIDHSIIAKLLKIKIEGSSKVLSKMEISNLIYFKSHIVVESGGLKSLPKNYIININKAAVVYRNALKELLIINKDNKEAVEELEFAIDDLEETATSKIGKDYGIDFYELNDIIHEYSDAKIMTGAKAIEYLLENLDLEKEVELIKKDIQKINDEIEKVIKTPIETDEELKDVKKLKDQKQRKIKNIQNQKNNRKKLYNRLDIINSFISSGQNPKDLLIYNLPVIPADLRPLIQIDGGRHSTSDVNELYRRIIIRNNRLKKWYELDAPVLIIQNELRMLQEAVDALVDNARKDAPVMSKDNRPLKSISGSLWGKKGRFRQNLLGKRVDYSGRSVIVVGPDLKMHQAGIPRQMVAKLFEPWIIKELIKSDLASSVKYAKKLIEEENSKIWPFVEKAIKGKVILLNRAPTLHRLSIQAFEPVLVRGKAIKLHPLVTTAFNADFDGDQMAVHVPISKEAIREAKELMLANKNILGPKDGEPIINPSQDMILGLYYLTKEIKGAKGEASVFSSLEELEKAYEQEKVSLHARVFMPTKVVGKQYLESKNGYLMSTVGKFILNKAFPKNFPFIFDNSKESLLPTYDKYIFKPGTNLKEVIKDIEIVEPLGKKDIAKIARQIFDQYTTEISKGDIAKLLSKLTPKTAKDTLMKFSKILNYKGEKLNSIHAQILSEIVKNRYAEIHKRILISNEGVERDFSIEEKAELLEKVWFDYTNIVAKSLDNIKDLGFRFSTVSGVTMSIYDIKQSKVKNEKIKEGEKYVKDLMSAKNKGLLTDDERYQLVIKKWAEIKNEIEKDLKDIAATEEYNPIFMMMKSGARGNISNFVQLAGLRGLMNNNQKNLMALEKRNILIRSIIEAPVKSSFLEGLTGFEFFSSTHGARKGLTDTAKNTAQSGYLTRKLVDISQNIIVKEENCGSDHGFIVKDIIDTKTNTIIVPMHERIEGRFANENIVHPKTDKVIVEKGTLITPKDVEAIIKAKIKRVNIRSVLGCHTKAGVCKYCYGKDLATNRLVQIGEPVGIIAAQSIGEPGTQLTMRTFHTGGVAGVEDITGGFNRLKQLIDAVQLPWTKNIISEINGEVISIENTKKEKIISIKSDHVSQKVYTYKIPLSSLSRNKLRVSKGDKVFAGQKLLQNGDIVFSELLDVAGPRALQSYLIKEMQRLYRLQGITVSDKYIEIIIRQMLSKIIIQDPGDSKFFIGLMIDIHTYTEENKKLIMEGKKPAYGQVIFRGAKVIPLLSESFLAAASYQETAKVLVYSSIAAKKDSLNGLKENIIVGHKIPAGTSSQYELNGKFDLRDPKSYFVNNEE